MARDIPASEPYLSQAKVAEICGVSPLTVWRWVDDGVLASEAFPMARKAGDARRQFRRKVRRVDLAAFMERHGLAGRPPGSSPRSPHRPGTRVYREKPFVGPGAVAVACGVDYHAAVRLIDRGVIPATRDRGEGRRPLRRVLRVDLAAYLRARAEGAGSDGG